MPVTTMVWRRDPEPEDEQRRLLALALVMFLAALTLVGLLLWDPWGGP